MRYFRRLPPLLRVVSIMGLLFFLTAVALLILVINSSVMDLLSSSPHAFRDTFRLLGIGISLALLAQVCFFAVIGYSTRFRRTNRGPFPLDSWQSQVRFILLVSALPLCALALVVLAGFIPPTPLDFSDLVGALAAVVNVLAVVVLVVAYAVATASLGPTQTPPTA